MSLIPGGFKDFSQTSGSLPVDYASLKDLADQGDPVAQLKVGAMYESTQNLPEAVKYLEQVVALTQQKVDALRAKILQKSVKEVMPQSTECAASSAVSATAAVAPVFADASTSIKAGFINAAGRSRNEDELLDSIAERLGKLGITVTFQHNSIDTDTKLDVDFMFINSGRRGIDSLENAKDTIGFRLTQKQESPVPLIIVMVSNDLEKLKEMFFDGEDTVPLLLARNPSPFDILVAPLCLESSGNNTDELLTQDSLATLKEEFAQVQNEPKKLRQFIVNVLTKSLQNQ